jgi:chromosome segregation ATPase
LSLFRKEERIQQLSNGKPDANNFGEKNEISILESQLNKIREQTSGSIIQQEALSLIDQIFELESKYDQLIEEDDENVEQYLNEIQKIQKTNLTLLTQLQTNLNQCRIEKQNSIDTLTEQHRKLKQDFIKLEILDQRLIDELHELKIKYTKMQEDIAKFNDLEGLKHQAERRKQRLTLDKINMIKQRQITQLEIQTLQSQFETLQTQLHDDQTHQQVRGLSQPKSILHLLF